MADHPIGKVWLALPWIILACGIPTILWWMFEPIPVRVDYVAPAFLSRPAINREDAASVYISEAKGGSTVYRYVSYCVSRPFEATTHRAWIGRALVWHAPDLPTMLSRAPGCFDANLAVEVPTSSPTRTFSFVQRMEIQLNPLRTETVEYAPIPLTILDSKQ
jgi:hypothetical protein